LQKFINLILNYCQLKINKKNICMILKIIDLKTKLTPIVGFNCLYKNHII